MPNPSKKTVLLVEDTLPLARMYEEYLRQENYDVVIADTGEKAKDYLTGSAPDAVVLDLLLPGINGLEVLSFARELYQALPVVVVTVNNSIDVAVEAMRRGAFDFIVKPFPAPRLTVTLRHALERKAMFAELSELRQATGQKQFYNFIGQSPAMQAVYRIIDSIAASKASVFIQGENGTGKELAAQAIHQAGARRLKPFVAINCAAIPRDLMESTLFGHVKGAFTGAVNDQPGAARTAHGGTLFLDEICELPLEMQTKLLRFAQTGEVMPVGGSKVEITDVRLIAASNRDVREEVRNRRFREDLYYRLYVIPLDMPPLRERDDDILMLASHFIARFNAEENKNFTGLSPDVASMFRRYDWPGNVRQLENVIRNVVVLYNAAMITEAMLPRDLKTFAEERLLPAANQNRHDLMLVDIPPQPLVKPLWMAEKEAIMQALNYAHQDVAQATALLEVSPSTLYRKLQLWRMPENSEQKKEIRA